MKLVSVIVLTIASALARASSEPPLPLAVAAHNNQPFRQSLAPDGRWVAEDVLVSSGKFRAHLRDLQSGEIVPLGDATRNVWAPVWSPDGTKLAYFQSDAGKATFWVRDASGRAREINGVSGVPLGPFSKGNAAAWLPGGDRLVTLLMPEGDDPPRDGIPLRHTPFAKVEVDEAEVTVYGGDEPDATPPLPPKPCGDSFGRCDLGIIDLRSGSVRRIAADVVGGFEEVAALHLSADGKYVAFHDQVKVDPGATERLYQVYLYQFTACEIATGRCQTLPKEGAEAGLFWRDKLPRFFPGIEWANTSFVQGRQDKSQTIEPPRDLRRDYALGEVRTLHWPATAAGAAAGALMLPHAYRSGQRLPLVVWIYPNDKGSQRGFKLRSAFDFHVLATRGYAVLYPDANTRMGTAQDDVIDAINAGVDAAIAQGFADPERLALMGCSAGSESALYALTRIKRFKAAELSCSVTHPEMTAAYLQGPPFARRDQIGSYYDRKGTALTVGATPWEAPELYAAYSAARSMDKIVTPILLSKGEWDSDDRIASDAIFLGLRRLGKIVEYRIYKHEGHGIERPANVVDLWKRRLAFLARHLDLRYGADGAIAFGEDRALSARAEVQAASSRRTSPAE